MAIILCGIWWRLSHFYNGGQKAPLDQTSQMPLRFTRFTTSQTQAYC